MCNIREIWFYRYAEKSEIIFGIRTIKHIKLFHDFVRVEYKSLINIIPLSNSLEMTFNFTLTFNELVLEDVFLSVISAAFGFYLLIILLVLKQSKFPAWVIRKIGHLLGGTYIAFIVFQYDSLTGIIFTICLFLILLVLFIVFSKGKLLTEYFMFNFRENENDYTFIINTITTLLVLFGLLLVFYNYPAAFVAGTLIISWGDTFGEVIGKTLPFVKYRIFCEKSISGTLGVFVFSLVSFLTSIIIFKIPLSNGWLWISILGSFTCTVIESISWKWFDNIALPPIGGVFMLWIILL